MSFAVLGARIAGVTIGQKSCVDKTYPEFWSDSSRKLGVQYEATDAAPATGAAAGAAAATSSDASAAPAPSIVLIGMRGAGKTHLGRAAASALDLTFLDLDEKYEKVHGKIMETVKAEGWPTFRKREVAMLRETLASCPTGHVLACGGGIVETEEGRALLKAHWPVAQAIKPIDEIVRYLGIDETRPDLGEPPSKVFARRKPWYDECADLDHVASPGESDFAKSCERFVQALRRMRGEASAVPAPPHDNSFFLSLTYPDLAAALPLPAALWTNTDAVELRADLLADQSLDNLRRQIALLRANCPLPIIFTIRSKAEAGAFAGTDDEYFAMNTTALRAGCEWIDLEASKDGEVLQAFARSAARLGAKLLGSNHVLGPMLSIAQIGEAFERCKLSGAADVVKYVGFATEPAHALYVHAAANAAGLTSSTPHIALAMGAAGRMSRVLNMHWTPVTHPLLPAAAAPGQLSAAAIIDARRTLGYLPSKQFYIFGKPTQHSPSPSMHNAGFVANGTAHTYGVCETDEVEPVLEALRRTGAGGGSVTIPLKEKLMPHIACLSPSAKAIGSLNTITVQPDGSLHADNTDWVGIRNLLVDTLKTARGNPPCSELTAVVMGGGGTARAACYALQQMGVGKLHVFNRSTDKAEALAAEFGGELMLELHEGVAALMRLDLLVSCVPGAAGLSLPDATLRKFSPIVLDAAYRPRDTPLLTAASAAGCIAIEGIEMLFEQGCAQSEIWTHRPAPRGAIAVGISKFLEEKEFGPLPRRIAIELTR